MTTYDDSLTVLLVFGGKGGGGGNIHPFLRNTFHLHQARNLQNGSRTQFVLSQ